MDSFTQYDNAARRIRDLSTKSSTEKRLQKAIYQRATSFLHLHMLPLKSLPKVLKHAIPDRRLHNESPIGSEACGPVVGGHTRVSALATIGYSGNAANGSANSVASDNSSALSALETEEKALREQLIVLEEQKFFVTKMIADANKRRRFDEVSSLAVNIEDLTKEIDHINGLLNKLDFEGVYTGSQSTA
jgi:rabenosyn-5